MTRDRLARIERVEAALAEPPASTMPLSRHERVELAELERERAARFPTPIDNMGMDALRDLMAWHAGDGHGAAKRLDHLRQRALPPEQAAAERVMVLAIDSMDLDTLDRFMVEMSISDKLSDLSGHKPHPLLCDGPEHAKGERI